MLTQRLNRIIDYVNTDILADIGCDHGYVATEVIRQGRAKRVIAADIRSGPLNAARENIKKHKLESVIRTRLGSGLSVVKPFEADTAVIAGMGGELIADIIEKDIETARSMELILQPMNSQYELRRYLINNGFTIKKEDIINEGDRVYNILIVENGEMKPFINDIEYHIPKYLKDNELFPMLFNKKKREFTKIVNGLRESVMVDSEKLAYYSGLLEVMEDYYG